MNNQSFSPNGSSQTISATSTSSSITLTAAQAGCTQLMVTNKGTGEAFIRWGVGAQTAVTTDIPILSGGIYTFNKGLADTVAAITSGSDTALVRVTPGEGT